VPGDTASALHSTTERVTDRLLTCLSSEEVLTFRFSAKLARYTSAFLVVQMDNTHGKLTLTLARSRAHPSDHTYDVRLVMDHHNIAGREDVVIPFLVHVR